MGVACPPGGNTRDGKGKGQGDVHGVAVGAEADFPTNETLETTQGGIVSGFPRPPDSKLRLARVDVTRTIGSVTVSTVSAVSTNQTIQAGFNGGNRILGFAEYPHLEHVTGFPIVRRMGKTRGDDNAGVILMKDVAIAHREPPTMSSAKQ